MFDPLALATVAGRIVVRSATAQDVEGMARVSVDTWRLTYDGILPATYLARLRAPAHEAQRRRLMQGPSTLHFVAVEPKTGEAVGFCSAGPARNGDASAEIYELYVQNGFQRQGVGRRLFAMAQARLAEQGQRRLIVWVLSRNPSRSFYERLGGEAAGDQTIRVGGAVVQESSYVWGDLARS